MAKKRWYQVALCCAVIIGSGIFYQSIMTTATDDTVKAEQHSEEGTIIVKGEGEVSAAPDLAFIRLGAQATHESAEEAQQNVNKRINAIREQLKAYDIDEDQIETTRYHVYPDHRQQEEEQYRAQHMLEIEYADIENIGELIDDATEAGANLVEQTRFTIEDSSELEREALEKAVKHTQPKAEAMAESAGRTTGEVVQISEQGTHIDVPVQNERAEQALDSAGSGAKTTINAGDITVKQQVNVVYRLK